MIGHRDASSPVTFLFLLMGVCFLPISNPSPVETRGLVGKLRTPASPKVAMAGDGTSRDPTRRGPAQNGDEGLVSREEEEEELFKDVDPKTLAAVLLEALNKPLMERGMGEEEEDGARTEEEAQREGGAKTITGDAKGPKVRESGVGNRDRDREGELELVMAAKALQGKEDREREEETERKKAQEEEERITEKVTSRTTSHLVQVKTEQHSIASAGGEEIIGKDLRDKEEDVSAPRTQGGLQLEGEQCNEEEEEQLSPEELRNLETMMKEFPSLSTASKIRDSQKGQREGRGFSPYNDVLPKNNGNDLAMSKKKLKWQEETQKAMNFPTFRGEHFMDGFGDHLDTRGGNNMMEEDGPDAEEEEEVLSPEEEEAQAKAEQEEVRRQAAEAQRAKMEEEKLADIASDMLLQYMVKQNSGNRKYRNQNGKYSSSLSNTAEDKRSDEVQEVEEDDDIDPETIDKLIEISSKLHLPADDVVDIISDVEKKKKKDLTPEMSSLLPWQQPLMPPSLPSSTKGISVSQIPITQNTFPLSKQGPPAISPLKTWFQEKQATKPSLVNQDLWVKPLKPLPVNLDILPNLQKPLSTNQDLWPKPQKTLWSRYPAYASYPSMYQKKPYLGYYPIYFPVPPKPKPRFYFPKPVYTLNSLLGNTVGYDYNLPTKRHFRNWVQSKIRKPPASIQKPYYANYIFPSYRRTFQQYPISKPAYPVRNAQIPLHLNHFYYWPPAPVVARNEDYYPAQIGNQAGEGSNDDLGNYIQQMLM